MLKIKEYSCQSILNRSRIRGIDYGINPYTGCTHKCQYCYAVFMKKYTGHCEPWGSFVDVKINAAQILGKQLKSIKHVCRILFGTVCDAYQPIEKKYELTRQCLITLLSSNHRVSILTKSPLVTRDIDVIKKLQNIEVGFTITTLHPKVRRIFEPGTSPPSERFKAIKLLSRERIRTWVFVAPTLPYFTDSESTIIQIIKRARAAGASYVMFDTLNPYPKVWKNIMRLVKNNFPEAQRHFRNYYVSRTKYNAWLKNKISSIAIKNMLPCKFAFGCG